MRNILLYSAAFLLLCTAVQAQSGRRVRQPATTQSTGTATSATRSTTAATAEKQWDDSEGYSESSPNASRPLAPSRGKSKDTKREDKRSPDQKPAAETPAPGDDEADVIKVETNLVTIPVSVADRNGFFITGLGQNNFKVFENGVEQKLEYFGTTDKPFTVVLLIDVSPSTSYKIEDIQAAASAFVEQLLPHDQVMVIQFDSSVDVLAEPTGDRNKIHQAIRRTGFGDGTSLYDAVDFSIKKRLDKIEGRKAIVLFTDGVDTSSGRADYTSTIRDAEESEAVIFPVYYNTFMDTVGIGKGGAMSTPPTLGLPGSIGMGTTARIAEMYTRGRAYLAELAGVTGGKVYRAESTPGGLSAAFESIADELRRQYVLGYYPANTAAAGERRQIRVRVDKPKLIIRTRDSYTVGGK